MLPPVDFWPFFYEIKKLNLLSKEMPEKWQILNFYHRLCKLIIPSYLAVLQTWHDVKERLPVFYELEPFPGKSCIQPWLHWFHVGIRRQCGMGKLGNFRTCKIGKGRKPQFVQKQPNRLNPRDDGLLSLLLEL